MKKIVFFIVCLLFVNTIFSQTIKKVTSAEVQAILQNLDGKKAIIIDGRNSVMFQSGHIKNAININAFSSNAENLISQYLDKKSIIIYCTMNNRSRKLIEILKKLEYKGEIIDMTDGITGWKANNFPVISSNQTD